MGFFVWTCNGAVSQFWGCIPVLGGYFTTNSWVWNAAMTSVNDINQDIKKRQCRCCLTGTNVISVLWHRPSSLLQITLGSPFAAALGLLTWTGRRRAAESNPLFTGSSFCLIKSKAKSPVMITGSESGQTPSSCFFLAFLFFLVNFRI